MAPRENACIAITEVATEGSTKVFETWLMLLFTKRRRAIDCSLTKEDRLVRRAAISPAMRRR